ncbi:MAG: hypothetical protein PHU49_11470 [Syntrophorhabdaceae bacterium]|nr:hypothetical protein [Syntrophorhabdaceae bacterium]
MHRGFFTFPMNSGTTEFMGSSMSDCADISYNQTEKKKRRLLCGLCGLERSGRETKGFALRICFLLLSPSHLLLFWFSRYF